MAETRMATTSKLVELLTAATLAPSGDNTQPWHFEVDADSRRVTLHVDGARDPSPMNAGDRMARIAVGAAAENLIRTAGHNGWEVDLSPLDPPTGLTVCLTGPDREQIVAEEALVARVTNRRPYDGREVAADLLAALARHTPDLEGVRTCWVVGRDRLGALAPLVGQADALMFGEGSMRRAFLSKVRFDLPPDEPAEEGLSLGTLEASRADRVALRLLPRLPDWLFAFSGARWSFASRTRRLVLSSSGLGLLVAPDGAEATDFVVGRAMQRAWLALTSRGLAVQPMMSWLVLENVLDHGPAELVAALGAERVRKLGAAFRALLPEIGSGRPAALLRFGYAPPPSARTGRLSVQALCGREARPDDEDARGGEPPRAS
jgi:nitroreductase